MDQMIVEISDEDVTAGVTFHVMWTKILIQVLSVIDRLHTTRG
jgi:hypothetical protein